MERLRRMLVLHLRQIGETFMKFHSLAETTTIPVKKFLAKYRTHPYLLVYCNGISFFHNTEYVVCRERNDAKVHWRVHPKANLIL